MSGFGLYGNQWCQITVKCFLVERTQFIVAAPSAVDCLISRVNILPPVVALCMSSTRVGPLLEEPRHRQNESLKTGP